jgi:hypothetical protein
MTPPRPLAEREGSVTQAVVELDALADAVAPAEDDTSRGGGRASSSSSYVE